MKSKGALLEIMAMMMGGMGSISHLHNSDPVYDMEEIKRKRKIKSEEKKKAQGVILFEIEGKEVWARDYKNALRKFNNLSK